MPFGRRALPADELHRVYRDHVSAVYAFFAYSVSHHVAEELTRLESHAAHFEGMLAADGAGRRLDFLLQEMSREANTLGSKSQDVKLSHLVVDIKSQLEKIREQVQNVE